MPATLVHTTRSVPKLTLVMNVFANPVTLGMEQFVKVSHWKKFQKISVSQDISVVG